MYKFFQVGLLVALAIVSCNAALESYNVDPASVTISGLSSGGAFVQQFHLAFSNEVHGAGIYAGLPFGCGKSGLTGATTCMSSPGAVIVSNLIGEIDSLTSAGKLDPTTNLNNDKVFIFHGTKDTTVNPAAGGKIQEIYEHYGVTVQTKFDIASVHGYPTNFYGAACGSSSAATHYINNCDYHGAFEMLQYLYGDLVAPTGQITLAGQLMEYEQKEFISALTVGAVSMDAHGFVYVPSECADKTKKCRFHIAFHGCQQSKGTLGDIYATKTGYLEVAELNNIIVLFPQAAANMLAGNPNACWEWWPYLNNNYLNHEGAQMKAVHNMLRRVVYCDGATPCYEDVTNPPEVTDTTTITTTTVGGDTPAPGECHDNEVSFHPLPGTCDYYTICACGVPVLQRCAPGLYFSPATNQCDFIQLVDCTDGKRH